ncbi:MAG TPA: hypothetical protein VIX73_11695 [Kofleriaceae bacterium]|jgi:hypothetical protein
MTLEQLRQQRARDMLAVIDAERPRRIPPFPAALRIGAARELEWIAHDVELHYRDQIREPATLHATVGVVAPYTPSILVVTYTARYYLARGEQPAARDVYVVYGALQATMQPETRGLDEL